MFIHVEYKTTGSIHLGVKSNMTHKLQYTDLYNQYLELFEDKMTSFIKREGSTIDAFYDDVIDCYIYVYIIIHISFLY